MATSISKKLEKLGYDKKWLKYGFFTEKELEEQYELHLKALKNPDGDLGGYQYSEHMRHASFIKIAHKNEPLTIQELNQLIDLVKLDTDSEMAENGLKLILEKRRTPPSLNTDDWGPVDAIYLHFKRDVEWENLLDGSDIQILELKFQKKSLFIIAIGLDDSILISDAPFKALKNFSKKDLSQEKLWVSALEKEVLFFWLLKNQHGYQDGFQIEFGLLEKGHLIIHGIVYASKFRFFTLNS